MAAAEALTVQHLAGPLTLACYIIAVLALLLRRRHPVLTFAATLPAAATGLLWLAPMIALSSVGAFVARRSTVLACTLLGFGIAVIPWTEYETSTPTPWTATEWAMVFLGPALFVAGPSALGVMIRLHGELTGRVTELSALRERERVLLAERAVSAERARLARELHDVVSHQVGLITIHAGVLEKTGSHRSDQAIGADIRRLGSRTLDELRDVLDVLRSSGPGASSGPATRLMDLPALIAASGLKVDCQFDIGQMAGHAWSAATEHAAYRAVQEALTNARKHAPGSPATVRVTSAAPDDGPRNLVVEIHNSAPAESSHQSAGPATLPGSGTGLPGLRDRAHLLGGHVHAAPTADGGFLVRLVLPGLAPTSTLATEPTAEPTAP
ncbi:sensor histidine kinase [Streptomyces sp. NPDC050658]|uniref:sensor histidine kinase n=1 Tax=unclassified Streptomyces TaxID=2593676 RepID=UPI003430BE79